MGASSYSGYSGKGSTNRTRSTIVNSVVDGVMVSREIGRKNNRNKSPMEEMLELLGEVERKRIVVEEKRSNVESAERELEEAKEDLREAERAVSGQINKLDPETKARFRRMMGGEEERDER